MLGVGGSIAGVGPVWVGPVWVGPVWVGPVWGGSRAGVGPMRGRGGGVRVTKSTLPWLSEFHFLVVLTHMSWKVHDGRASGNQAAAVRKPFQEE
jgi:hypothetical protein